MSTLLFDTFTGANGTNLEAHTPESGGTWTKISDSVSTGTISLNNGSLFCNSTNAAAIYMYSAIPATNNYTVSAPCTLVGSARAGDQLFLGVRWYIDGNGKENGYFAAAQNPGAGLVLYKMVAGNGTQVANFTNYSVPFTATNGNTFSISSVGSTINVTIGGVIVISYTDPSPNLNVGQAMLGMDNATTPSATQGLQFLDVAAVDTNRGSKYLCCDGDSLTFSMYATVGQGMPVGTTYPGQLASMLGPTWAVDNFGIPGYTIAQLASLAAARIDTTYLSSRTYDALIMAGGINDTNRDYALGQTQAQCATNIQNDFIAYWTARKSATPGRIKIGTTVPPVGIGATVVNAAFTIGVSSIVNSWILANWQKYLDYLVAWGNDNRLVNDTGLVYYQQDQTHHTDAGNTVWAQDVYGIEEKLQGILNVPSTGFGGAVFSGSNAQFSTAGSFTGNNTVFSGR